MNITLENPTSYYEYDKNTIEASIEIRKIFYIIVQINIIRRLEAFMISI